MKLQYNTVEYNIQQINEQLHLIKSTKSNSNKSRQVLEQINESIYRLRESIKRGDWYSQDLIIVNGPGRIKSTVFYIPCNKKYSLLMTYSRLHN